MTHLKIEKKNEETVDVTEALTGLEPPYSTTDLQICL